MLLSAQTISRESSSTITPPEPAIDPAAASESKSIGISSIDISRSIVDPSVCFCLSLNRSSARRTFAELPPGITAFSFERFNQSSFFAADVSARPAMDVNFNIEAGAENIASKEIMFARLFDGAFEDFRAFRKFASCVNVGCARIQRETGDQDSFEQLMGIFVDDVTVLKRA